MNSSGDVGVDDASSISKDLASKDQPNGGHVHRRRSVLGALDLGTNNCRLLVATPNADGFRVIDAFSRIVRLGEGLARSGKLGEAAMERTIEALKICASKLGRRQATRTRSVATEACRLADNSSEFVDRVREETGLALDIISPSEESRLAVMGCRALFKPAAQFFLVFDIGGGSTELTCVERLTGGDFRILDWLSLPIGVVRLSEEAENVQNPTNAFADAAELVREQLRKFSKRLDLIEKMKSNQFQMIGSSGTVTTLASVALGLENYDRSIVDGSSLESRRMIDLAREIAAMNAQERAAVPCIGSDRADLLVPGCAVLEAILEALQIEHLTVADRGIREGILRSLISSDQQGQLFLAPETEAQRKSALRGAAIS